jgi:anti-anti-sigma factor
VPNYSTGIVEICEGALDEIPFTALVDGRRPAVVRLTGELDLASATQLQSVLARLDGDVELDCSGLDFIDAAGLRAFEKARDGCAARGCKLVLVDPSPAVDRLLRMVNLDSVFLIRQARESS